MFLGNVTLRNFTYSHSPFSLSHTCIPSIPPIYSTLNPSHTLSPTLLSLSLSLSLTQTHPPSIPPSISSSIQIFFSESIFSSLPTLYKYLTLPITLHLSLLSIHQHFHFSLSLFHSPPLSISDYPSLSPFISNPPSLPNYIYISLSLCVCVFFSFPLSLFL